MLIIRHGFRPLAWGLIALLAMQLPSFAQSRSPTPEQYVEHVGGEAVIVPPGEFVLDGMRLYCGTRPTVIDNKLDDYGAAYPGFLIMNKKLLDRVG